MFNMQIGEVLSEIFGPNPLWDTVNDCPKSSRANRSLELVSKHVQDSLLEDAVMESEEDDREGRIGPKIVRFDVKTRLGLFSVSPDRLSITAVSKFASMKANTAVYNGKWMYEVQLGSKGLMQIGWCTVNCKFTQESGVGDTRNSYAFDGNRIRKWNVSTHFYGEQWFTGDIIGCAIDLTKNTVQFHRNGKPLGVAFQDLPSGSSFAYFPAASLAIGEFLTANFGSAPFKYPIEGFQALQRIPVNNLSRSKKVLNWFDRMIRFLKLEEAKISVETNFTPRSYFLCLIGVIMGHHGPVMAVPYVVEEIWLPFIRNISQTRNLLITCLDLLWIFLPPHEIKIFIETMVFSLLRDFKHVSSLEEYEDQSENLKILNGICQHVETKQFLLRNLLFEQMILFNFLNVKPPDKNGLIKVVEKVWWETKPVDLEVEQNKKDYMEACEKLAKIYSELEELQVDLLITLLDNSDGNEKRPSSRSIFLKKLKNSIPIVSGNPAPITLLCMYRLLLAFRGLWEEEIGTFPVYVPCRVFYDGSMDFSRHERLGGVASHLTKLLHSELVGVLGPNHPTTLQASSTADSEIPRASFPNFPLSLLQVINIHPFGAQNAAILDPNPPEMGPMDVSTSLYSFLDVIIIFYNLVAKKPLVKIAQLRNTMNDYVSVTRQLKTRLNEAKIKRTAGSKRIEEELSRSLIVFHEKLKERGRYMVWIRAAVFNARNKGRFAYLLNIIVTTLIKASSEGNLFGFVPDFYLETMADLCFAIRIHFQVESANDAADFNETFALIADFLCEHFLDPRIVTVNSRNCLLLMLARFAFGEKELRCLENVEEGKRDKLVGNLVKSFRDQSWAEPNWILMRFWQGNGFAFRYQRSPHLERRIRAVRTEIESQNRSPCPSPIFQKHLKHALLENSQETTAFLNKFLNLLNWTFSEFVGMIQEIQNAALKSSRVFIDANQLKTCDTCFDLTVSLLRVLEMIVTLLPNIFTDSLQNFADNLLFRLCQLLCQVLNRTSSKASCFERVVRLEIPDLELVDYFPILTAVTGILLALLQEEMAEFDRKLGTEVGKTTETLLTEPSFQMSTIHFLVGDSKQQFSLLSYPDHVTEEEIDKVRRMIDYLEECRRILPKPKTSNENNESCTICYAQPIAVTFKPCNHQTCRICIDRHLLNSRYCFFCKITIETVVDLSGNVIHEFHDRPAESSASQS